MELREQVVRAIESAPSTTATVRDDCESAADAVLEVLRQQKPVAWMGTGPRDGRAEFSVSRPAGCVMRDFNMQPLFLAPGAQSAVSEVQDKADLVSKALRQAYQLGQTYWQQADSERTSDWKRADATQEKFDTLVDETRAALLGLENP